KDTPANWAEAEKMFLRAAESPSIFPVRQPALFGAVSAAWFLSREGPTQSRAAKKRQGADNLRKLVRLGLRPEQGYPLSLMGVYRGEVDLARWVLSEWQRQRPKDPRLPGQRVVVAYRSGEYARAVELIDEIVKRDPRQAGQWQGLRAEAVARLKEATPR